jgi:(p)ppGpp synthase/HD superfamily hydrolase
MLLKMTHNDPLAELLTAVRFAAEKHRLQRRKDPDASPYINHLIEVASILSITGGVSDLNLLQAAVLHDTLEDTDTTADELQARFGARVRFLVEEVTDDQNLPEAEQKRQQVEHAPQLSIDAKQLKLADKISNIGDLRRGVPREWSLQRCLDYMNWAGQVVAGCRGANAALEAAFDQAAANSRQALLENTRTGFSR